MKSNSESEAFDRFIEPYQPRMPRLKCPSGHSISLACASPICPHPAFHCQSAKCELCIRAHDMCPTIDLSRIYASLMGNFEQQKKFYQMAFRMEVEVIRMIRESQEQLNRNILTSCIGNPHSRRIVEEVFLNSGLPKCKGSEISELAQELKANNHNTEEKVYRLKQSLDRIQDDIKGKLREKERLFERYQTTGGKEVKNPFKLSSQIVTSEQETDFVKNSLKSAKGFKLLFRASEYGFSSQKFHEECDYKADTLVLVKTLKGAVIGGYTPLQWMHPRQPKEYHDDSKRSFWLDFKEHAVKPLSRFAIGCGGEFGPIMGHEIYLSDKCNISNDGKARVQEYEVFKVFF